jgi:F-type H+-transporting ATPase subunit delta
MGVLAGYFAFRAQASQEVRLFLTTPRVPAQRKLETVKDLLRGVDPMVVNMIGLLLARQSIDLLPGIRQDYRRLLDESLGRVYASVTTAVALSTAQEGRLQQSLGQALEREVVLDVHQDPEIIGGLVVRVGDQIMEFPARGTLGKLAVAEQVT